MPRQRKGKHAASSDDVDVPLVKPSELVNKQSKKPLVELSEEEQWRLINESGILNKIPIPKPKEVQTSSTIQVDDAETPTLVVEILNTIFYVVPFSFLLAMMEMLIHYQYSTQPTFAAVFDRLLSGVPIMSILIFYTLRYKDYRVTQIILCMISVLSGCRLIYQVNKANWLTNMKQCPPLATLWIFAIVQADLGPAVSALLAVCGFVWWKDLKIIT